MVLEQALKGSNIFLKRVTEELKMKAKEQKGGFLSMLLLVCFQEIIYLKKKRMGHT